MATLSRRAIARVIAAKLLTEPARRSHWLRATAAYLVEHTMAHTADLLMNDIAHEIFVQSGKLFVDVTSARPLTVSVREDLARMLQEATQAKQITLSEHVDPSLIGGVVAQTPSAQLDLSVRTRLQQLATIK